MMSFLTKAILGMHISSVEGKFLYKCSDDVCVSRDVLFTYTCMYLWTVDCVPLFNECTHGAEPSPQV